MKIQRGKQKNKIDNKKITLGASVSNVYAIPFTFPLLEYLPENLFLPLDIKVLIIPGCLLSLILTVLLTKKGYRWWDPNQEPIPEERERLPETETDKINRLTSEVRNDRDQSKYQIAPILCQQATDNHAKQLNLSHNQFPANKPHCHMNNEQIARFATIWDSLPWTCDAHVLYQVKEGIVCYRDTGKPVSANSDIIRYVAGYEQSGGTWPRLNHLEADMRKLEEWDRRNPS